MSYHEKQHYTAKELQQFALSDLKTDLRCTLEQGDREGFPEYAEELKAQIAALEAEG